MPARIIVVGTSCAGKSTFARRLAAHTGLAYVELDALYWGQAWQPKPPAEFRRLVSEATAPDAWIADGNYGVVRDLLWSRAQMVIWLNYTYPRVLWQALGRTLRRCLSRAPLWHGNRESVRRSFFTRQSILVWVATTFHRRQHELSALRGDSRFSHLQWIEFTRPADATRWLAGLRGASELRR